jgi:hypothetical protein
MSQYPSPVGASGALSTTESTPAGIGSGGSIQTSSDIPRSPMTVIPQTEHWVSTANAIPVSAEQSSFPSSDLSPVGATAVHDAGLIGLTGTEGSGDWWLL